MRCIIFRSRYINYQNSNHLSQNPNSPSSHSVPSLSNQNEKTGETRWRPASTPFCSSIRRQWRACRRRFTLSSSLTSAIAMSGVPTKPSALSARSSALSSLTVPLISVTHMPFLIPNPPNRSLIFIFKILYFF